jgi:cold shock CspA family protein
MVDPQGAPTTGLLTGVRYIKDNRLLPTGMIKAQAGKDIAVHGDAVNDADFNGGGDRVQFHVDVGNARGAVRVEAELLFQSIGYRWAQNLKAYDAAEPRRFVDYYEATAQASAEQVASATTTVP